MKGKVRKRIRGRRNKNGGNKTSLRNVQSQIDIHLFPTHRKLIVFIILFLCLKWVIYSSLVMMEDELPPLPPPLLLQNGFLNSFDSIKLISLKISALQLSELVPRDVGYNKLHPGPLCWFLH